MELDEEISLQQVRYLCAPAVRSGRYFFLSCQPSLNNQRYSPGRRLVTHITQQSPDY